MDTILPYKNDTIRAMIQKFTNLHSRHYNRAFAEVVDNLKSSADTFNYILDRRKDAVGAVRYENGILNIYIIVADVSFGTAIAAEGILFEETWHAKQFLEGQTLFEFEKDHWGARTNIWLEVDAKMFAANQLGTTLTYHPDAGDTVLFTELGYMRCILQNDTERAEYLKRGGDCKICKPGKIKNKTVWPNEKALYSPWTYEPVPNNRTEIEKSNTVFAYPRRLHVINWSYWTPPPNTKCCQERISWK